ncbi:Cadmium-transporting ATPase [Paenibacillus sp. CECT 9249]|uniref:heavy metal translocating P-type ATPase n=1 Tax=Paenibacillus sp. CECT 9249 TaxID=2845385 RepID=UPI001E558E68|nr:heavy metal translocating P-type ATPase [Paenibacillus sp. CECT 9249]CAH0118680.1 Cadmium-transporting ATPase [Paenibacillus sp. CECT 9249]
MLEFRVKGLSCANCSRELEQKIQKLEHGEGSTLSYNTGKLKVDEHISLAEVEQILRSDGAYIDQSYAGGTSHPEHAGHHHRHSHAGEHGAHDHSAGDGHNHSHGSTNRMKVLLIAAAAVFVLAIGLQQFIPDVAAIAMYLFSIAISGYVTFMKGLRNLARFKFNIDTLMTIALIGAVLIGEWKEATLVAILFGLNELLEGMGMEKARRSMESLLQVAPKEAVLIAGGRERVVPISSLEIGDIVLVRAGEKIPSDGTVIAGSSSVNEAAITGESLPVDKAEGQPVFGGSINNEGVLQVRIDKAYKDSSLAKILHLVEEAQETKTPTELFINRFAKYYTPLILAVAILVVLVPPLLLGGDWKTWLYQGLAVLIVGCPCALILSSPIALVSGITRNARNGILVKGGVFLEQLGKIDTLAFDKTGTLTLGEPHVEQTAVYDKERFYSIAAGIEKTSSHPLAKAVMKHVEKVGAAAAEPEDIRTLSGQGIEARIDGRTYYLGNEKSVESVPKSQAARKDIERLKAEGLTLVIVADEHGILGVFGIADEIRPESAETVAALHRSGIRRTVMLTGDHQRTAEKVAAAVGVTSCYGGLLPEQKVEKIKELASDGQVAMIGDGINDAPALASAGLGIAMGKGTDSAIETADIVLMQDHLGKLPEAISIGKKVNRIIKANIALALGLKLIALLLTIPGLLTLWIAILSDMGATIIVTLLSLTVLLDRKRRAETRI